MIYSVRVTVLTMFISQCFDDSRISFCAGKQADDLSEFKSFSNRITKNSNQILKSDLSNRIFIVQIESLNVLNRDLNPNRLLNLVTSEARMLREHRDNYGTSYGPVSAWLCWVSMNGMGVTGYKDGKEGKGNNWE